MDSKGMLFFSFLILLSLPIQGAVQDTVHEAARQEVISSGPFAGLSPQEVLTTPYRELREQTGIKLGFFHRMALRKMQRRYRKRAEKKRYEDYTVQNTARSDNNHFGLAGLVVGGAGLFLMILVLTVPLNLGFAVVALLLGLGAGILGIVGLIVDKKPFLAIGALLTVLLIFLVIDQGGAYFIFG